MGHGIHGYVLHFVHNQLYLYVDLIYLFKIVSLYMLSNYTPRKLCL